MLGLAIPLGHFKVTICADWAPFGKENEANSWLIRFLNLGNRVASCEDNFLILGANCKENHPAMIKYVRQIKGEIANMESQTYEIQGHEDVVITLKFELVHSDMKWLATFSGELSNAAMYLSSLANVKKDNLSNIHGSLGNKNTSTMVV